MLGFAVDVSVFFLCLCFSISPGGLRRVRLIYLRLTLPLTPAAHLSQVTPQPADLQTSFFTHSSPDCCRPHCGNIWLPINLNSWLLVCFFLVDPPFSSFQLDIPFYSSPALPALTHQSPLAPASSLGFAHKLPRLSMSTLWIRLFCILYITPSACNVSNRKYWTDPDKISGMMNKYESYCSAWKQVRWSNTQRDGTGNSKDWQGHL